MGTGKIKSFDQHEIFEDKYLASFKLNLNMIPSTLIQIEGEDDAE